MMWPEPIITSPETQGWEWWPRSVESLRKWADFHGWDVRVGFSRGHVPGRARDSMDLVDMIGVWVDGYGRRAAHIWERKPNGANTWSTGSVLVWNAPGLAPFPYLNQTELKEWLSRQGTLGESVYESARLRANAPKAKMSVPTQRRKESGG